MGALDIILSLVFLGNMSILQREAISTKIKTFYNIL